MTRRNSGAMPKAIALTFVVLAAFVLVARLTQHGGVVPTTTAKTTAAQASPCPSYRQDQAPGPNAVPVYPNATKIRDESADTMANSAEPFRVTSVKIYSSADDPTKILVFYANALQKDGWRSDTLRQNTSSVSGATGYFIWSLDTKPWTKPPCNATVISELGFLHVKLELTKLSSGETRIKITQGVTPGM